MRVAYHFGEFRYYGEISDGQMGQDIYLLRPMPHLNISTMRLDNETANHVIKKMRFVFKRQLDDDLVVYEYADES